MKLQNHDQTKRIKNVFLDYDKLKQFDDIISDAIKQSSRKITYSKDVKFSDNKDKRFELESIDEIRGRKIYELYFQIREHDSYNNLSINFYSSDTVILSMHLKHSPGDMVYVEQQIEQFLINNCKVPFWDYKKLLKNIWDMSLVIVLAVLFIPSQQNIPGEVHLDSLVSYIAKLLFSYITIQLFLYLFLYLWILPKIIPHYNRINKAVDGRTSKEMNKPYIAILSFVIAPLVVGIIIEIIGKII